MESKGMRIGEAATCADVTVETLRYYERRGLLGTIPRLSSKYRLFSPEAVRRVRLIRWAQSLGFDLEEIRALVSPGQVPRSQNGKAAHARVAQKIQEIDRLVEELGAIRARLHEVADCHCQGRCPIVAAALRDDARSPQPDREALALLSRERARRRSRSAQRPG